MALKGQLEDLPLLDMLQIIAFSKKSGYLRVQGPPGRGAIVLDEGRILFACSWSTMDGLRAMSRDPQGISQQHIRDHIEASIRELGGLREGSFNFELTDEFSGELGGVTITPFVLSEGLDPQELLLDLAVEIDNERKETTSLLQLAFQGGELPPEEAEQESEEVSTELPLEGGVLVAEESSTAPSPPEVDSGAEGPHSPSLPPRPESFTVILVDDEEPVTDVVGEELERTGYRVFAASTPAEGARLASARLALGDEVLVAADLKMPTSSGRSFYGGFELIRRLRQIDPGFSTVLMVESLSEKARVRAKEIGIRRLVYKPTLTKPDPDLYRADLHEFAQTLHAQLMKLVGDRAQNATPNGKPSHHPSVVRENVDFLAAMTKKLVEPEGSTDISKLVLQVAERFLERGVLFVVKGDRTRGLRGVWRGSGRGGFGKYRTAGRARDLRIETDLGGRADQRSREVDRFSRWARASFGIDRTRPGKRSDSDSAALQPSYLADALRRYGPYGAPYGGSGWARSLHGAGRDGSREQTAATQAELGGTPIGGERWSGCGELIGD